MTSQPLLFVQGAGDKDSPLGSGHLIEWIGRELGPGYEVVGPAMPGADDPHYRPWRAEIKRLLKAMSGPVILVGHSFGGSVLLKYLAEGSPPAPIRGLFLVSTPFWPPEFEDFALPPDFASRLPSTPVFIYHSRDDPTIPFSHAERYSRALPAAVLRPIAGAGIRSSMACPNSPQISVHSGRRASLDPVTIKRMDHVGLVVRDLAAAMDFFVQVGLVLDGEATVEGDWMDRWPPASPLRRAGRRGGALRGQLPALLLGDHAGQGITSSWQRRSRVIVARQ